MLQKRHDSNKNFSLYTWVLIVYVINTQVVLKKFFADRKKTKKWKYQKDGNQ